MTSVQNAARNFPDNLQRGSLRPGRGRHARLFDRGRKVVSFDHHRLGNNFPHDLPALPAQCVKRENQTPAIGHVDRVDAFDKPQLPSFRFEDFQARLSRARLSRAFRFLHSHDCLPQLVIVQGYGIFCAIEKDAALSCIAGVSSGISFQIFLTAYAHTAAHFFGASRNSFSSARETRSGCLIARLVTGPSSPARNFPNAITWALVRNVFTRARLFLKVESLITSIGQRAFAGALA